MYTPLFSGLGIFDCDFLQALKTNHIHSLNLNHYEKGFIIFCAYSYGYRHVQRQK